MGCLPLAICTSAPPLFKEVSYVSLAIGRPTPLALSDAATPPPWHPQTSVRKSSYRPTRRRDGDGPFDLDVRFLASPDAHIAPGTLKIEVKKMLWGVDVTEHVKPFADATGIRMTQAEFPRGHHTVTLEIADERGRVTAKTVTMNVR